MGGELAQTEKSCWDCSRQRIGGDTFLGICTYFESVGKDNKPIPVDMVDRGCKFWEKKDAIGR